MLKLMLLKKDMGPKVEESKNNFSRMYPNLFMKLASLTGYKN